MCLMRILPPPVQPTGHGFVVRKTVSGSYRSLFYNHDVPQVLNKEQSIEEAETLESQEDHREYPCGFHIWESLDAAWEYAICDESVLLVLYRGAHTRGTHNGQQVVVAEHITLIREVDNVS